MLKRSYLFLLNLVFILSLLFAYGFSFLLTMQSDNRYEWMKAENVVRLPADADSPERVRMFIYLIVIFVFIAAIINFIKYKKSYFINKLFWFSLIPFLYAIWRYLNLVSS